MAVSITSRIKEKLHVYPKISRYMTLLLKWGKRTVILSMEAILKFRNIKLSFFDPKKQGQVPLLDAQG